MTARFLDPNTQYLTRNGSIAAQAKFTFYESGTTTLKTIYSNQGQTAQATNPAYTNDRGELPEIFFDGAAKIVREDLSNGVYVQRWELDPVFGSGDSSGFVQWSSEVTYNAGDIVQASDDNLYVSKTNSNLNNDPTTSSDNWRALTPQLDYEEKTAGFTAISSDLGHVFNCTSGTFTIDFTAAATLGDGWYCYIRNSGSGVITLDPNGSETINGVSTDTLNTNRQVMVISDGTNLQYVYDIQNSRGGANVINFNTSGTGSAGNAIALNSDGTVSAVVGAVENVGTETQYEAGRALANSVVYVGSNKVVITYYDTGDANAVKSVVGTVSGTSISFGTPVSTGFTASGASHVASCYDSTADKVIIAVRDTSDTNKGKAIVGTVSGTSISFGSATIFLGSAVNYLACSYDPVQNKSLILYSDGSNDRGYGITGTVTGTSIAFNGSAAVFGVDHIEYTSAAYNPTTDNHIILYEDNNGGSGNTARMIAAVVTGDVVGYGTANNMESANMISKSSITYDSTNDRMVGVYATTAIKAVAATVSGSTITVGTIVTVDASGAGPGVSHDATAGKTVTAYNNGLSGDVSVISGTGTTITVDSTSAFEAQTVTDTATVYDSDSGKIVIASETNTTNGEARVYTTPYTNLTSTNLLGLADEAFVDASTVDVNTLGGVNADQSGLTIGSVYYVDNAGVISTDNSGEHLGLALSATEILVGEGV